MPNPLFNALGGNIQQPTSGPAKMMQDLIQFKNNFKGDAKQEVMRLVQSGKISQQELNELQTQAQQIRQMFQTMR